MHTVSVGEAAGELGAKEVDDGHWPRQQLPSGVKRLECLDHTK